MSRVSMYQTTVCYILPGTCYYTKVLLDITAAVTSTQRMCTGAEPAANKYLVEYLLVVKLGLGLHHLHEDENKERYS